MCGLAVAALVVLSFARLAREHRPDPKWRAAREIARIALTTNGVLHSALRTPHSTFLLVGDWDPEFVYLSLLLPDSSLLCLPDLALDLNRDYSRFLATLEQRIAETQVRQGRVFVVNVLNRSPGQLEPLYVRRLGFARFLSQLAELSQQSRLVWSDPQTGATLSELPTSE